MYYNNIYNTSDTTQRGWLLCENGQYAYQEYISSESVQLPWIAFLHIDITSSGENYISGGVVV